MRAGWMLSGWEVKGGGEQTIIQTRSANKRSHELFPPVRPLQLFAATDPPLLSSLPPLSSLPRHHFFPKDTQLLRQAAQSTLVSVPSSSSSPTPSSAANSKGHLPPLPPAPSPSSAARYSSLASPAKLPSVVKSTPFDAYAYEPNPTKPLCPSTSGVVKHLRLLPHRHTRPHSRMRREGMERPSCGRVGKYDVVEGMREDGAEARGSAGEGELVRVWRRWGG